jgi:hypothetical protein
LLGENSRRDSGWRWSCNDREKGRDKLRYDISYTAKLRLRLMDKLIIITYIILNRHLQPLPHFSVLQNPFALAYLGGYIN